MSGRKDRERAELGYIFRDGQLWKKEDWYALHPTRDMVKATQDTVNAAVGTELDKKFGGEAHKDKPYQCGECGRTHRPGSAIYREHLEFKGEKDEVS